MNISVAELARRIGQTPQNFNKKLKRETVTLDELKAIADNLEHLHSGINFITPYQRHHGLDKKIIENRIKVYELAKSKNPSRWSRGIKDWTLSEIVTLNSMREQERSLVVKEQRL